MADNDHRQLSRDSLFLLAELRLEGADEVHRVKVRNLSAGGMMAEGAVGAERGLPVAVQIRNIGWVEGTIAWIQGDRCGIAFADDIDPMIARAPVAPSNDAFTPRYVKPPIDFAGRERNLRKI